MKKPTRTFVSRAALPTGTLLLGLCAGWMLGPSGDTLGPDTSEARGEGGATHLSNGVAAGGSSSPGGGTSRTSRPQPASVAPSAALVTNALSAGDRLGRLRALLGLMENLEADAFAGVLEQMEAEDYHVVFREEYLLVLSAWAERDPLAAAQHLVDSGTGDDGMKHAVMAAWAARDPLAAEEWARSLPEGDERSEWLVGVVQGVASSDIDVARGLIEELDGRDQRWALRSTLGHVLLSGEETAAAWIEQLPEGRLQSDSAEWIGERLADRDPAAAAAWVSELPTAEARRDASEEVAERYARENLADAQKWVESLPADTRHEAAEGIVDELARENPVAAFNWLSQLGDGPEYDGARRDIVRRGFGADPAAALTTALHLADDRMRSRFTSRYLERWFDDDPAAAGSWLRQHAAYVPENVRSRYTDGP